MNTECYLLVSYIILLLMVDSGHNMRNREHTMFNNMTTTSNIRIINFVPAKTFQHGWVSAGYSVIYQADLSVHEVLDLHRIHCIINHTFGKEALNFLQISASNGRDSVVFSLPDVTTDGSIIYESSRLLLPLLSGDITEGRNQTLTVKVQTRLLEDVFYNLRVVNYDRAQYNVRIPSKSPKMQTLKNQTSNYAKPLSYRLNLASYQILRISIRSLDDTCGMLVISDSKQSVYASSIYGGYRSSIHSLTFTRKLDITLHRENIQDVMNIYIFVFAEDTQCDFLAVPRSPILNKKLDITWLADEEISFIIPVCVFLTFFLLPPFFLLAYAFVSTRIKLKNNGHCQQTISENVVLQECVGNPKIPFDSDRTSINEMLDRDHMKEGESGSEKSSYNVVPTKLITLSIAKWSWTEAQFVFILIPALSSITFYGWQWREIMYPGIYDVCFHNYACAHSLFGWVSFNHMISNMGYAINATLYLSFIKIRRNRGCQGYGTFGNYGLELCIALSLFCESFASAVYHICPNGTSYYFDTPFIQVICVLIMLKIYGNRRGTVSPQLTNLFIAFIFGMDITIPIFGRHSIFCGVLMIGHMIVVCAYLSKICVFRKVSISNFRDMSILHVKCLFFIIFTVIINLLLSIYLFTTERFIENNHTVTVLCIVNMLIYILYYHLMKLSNNEPRCTLSRIAVVVSVILWGASIHFFLLEETNWTLTAAQSRSLNRDCILLSFFDIHDMWHLLSAHAALASLIAISTVDDALTSVPCRNLVIF